MPIQTNCPQCQSPYRLPDTQKGKRVRCKKCTAVFTAGDGDVPVLAEATTDDLRPKRPSQLGPVVEELPLFDEIAPEPRSRPTPAVRRPAYDDRPPRREDDRGRPYDDPPPPRGNNNLLLVLGALGGVLVLAGLGLAAVFFFADEPEKQQAGTTGQGGTNNPIRTGKQGNGGQPIRNVGGENDPVAPRDLDTALAYLNQTDAKRRKLGLAFLKTASVDPSRRGELDRALDGLIDDSVYKRDAIEVVLRWGGKHQMTALEDQMKDAFKWKEAMTLLAKMDDEKAAEMIAEHLGKVFHEEEAAKALKRMGKQRAEKAAVKYLHHRRAREHLLPLVKEWRTDDEVLAVQAVEDLSAKDRDVKAAAAETLGECKVVAKQQEKVAKALAEHMVDDWFGSRKKTAKALAMWATADTLDTVHAYMNDRELEVRVYMIAAAARIKDDKSIPHLVNRLGADEKQIAAKAVVLYGSKAEKSVQELLAHKEAGIRLIGVQLLSVLGTKDSVALLTKLAKIDAALKKTCNEAIKVIEAREKKEMEKKDK